MFRKIVASHCSEESEDIIIEIVTLLHKYNIDAVLYFITFFKIIYFFGWNGWSNKDIFTGGNALKILK